MTRPHPYRPPLLPPPVALIRVYTCDTRSHNFHGTHTATAQHLRGRRWLHISSTAHCSLFTAHWTYTFSAKERDPETGLSYFGSRYYSSDLSIWLSVDPMSDKYPSLSPYVYCANNPVKLVDPNGEDIWEINNETGKVTRTKDNTQDVIRVVDNDGNVIKDKDGNLQTLSYKYGTIRHYTTKKDGYDVFRIRGDGNGTDLFELMANYNAPQISDSKLNQKKYNFAV